MAATMKITKAQAKKMIENCKVFGMVFGVEFIKKDNTVRKMACRLGVQKHRTYTNRPPTTAHIEKYITVYEMNGKSEKSYKNVNMDTLRMLTVDGITFKIM